MVTFDLDLARRFDGVPMAAGMLLGSGAMVVAVDGPRVLLVSMATDALMPMGWVTSQGMALDYRDPGTRGHILAAVRAAWMDPTMAPQFNAMDADEFTVGGWSIWLDGTDTYVAVGPTEAHVLAAAWEGRPR